MNRLKAQQLARTLMDKHGLTHVPFEFDRGKRRLGATHMMYPLGNKRAGIVKKITLSAHYVDLLPEDEIRDVILHEIAHALAPSDAGHDYRWRAMARQVGAKPQRCATPSAAPEPAVKGMCASCGHVYKSHRLPLRVKMCGKCPAPQKSRILEYTKNGRAVPLNAMPARYREEMAAAKRRGIL